MAIAYVGDTLSSAANGNLVFCFAYKQSGSMTTPAGWTQLLPNVNPYNLQVWSVASWSTSMSTSPSFGSAYVQAYAVYSGAYLDSITASTSTTGVSPQTNTSATTDWIISVVGGSSTAGSSPTLTTPSGLTLREENYVAAPTYSISFADSAARSVPSGRSNTYTWNATGTSSIATPAVSIAIVPGTAPSAPTLQTPTPGSYVDMSTQPTFTATYNDVDGSSCAAYQFRQKVSGASSYQYWNAPSAVFQSTAVWNTGSMSLLMPNGAMPNGSTYNWSFNSQSSYGSTYTSGFASDATLVAQAAPTVTVSAPTGQQTTSTPTVTWAFTGGGSATETGWQVVTYLTSTTTATGFTVGQTSGLLDNSGIVAGNATSYTITTNLPNSSSLKSYVQVTESGGQTSAWVAASYTTLYAVPTTPTITATATTDGNGTPCVSLAVGNITSGNTLYVYASDANNPTPFAIRNANGLAITASTATVYDYEAAPNVTRTYYAVQVEPPTTADGNETLPSVPSSNTTATLTVANWWLIDPVVPSASVQIFVTASTPSEHEQVTAHYPLGWEFPQIQQDVVNGIDGTLTVETLSVAQETALMANYRSQRVQWLISPYGDARYVSLGNPPVGVGISGQLAQTTLNVSPSTTPYRTIVLQYVQVGKP